MDSKERNTDDGSVHADDNNAVASGGSSEGKYTSEVNSVEGVRLSLANHIGTLRFLNSSLMVCVQALQQQDAEMDSDIALILQRSVSDKLDETIDRIESIALGTKYEEG